MTREEAIEIINRENDPNDKKVWELFPEYREALDMAIQVLEQQPSDTVSRGVFEQVMWERDVAIGQLNELGYGLGQKVEPCDDTTVRKKKEKTEHDPCETCGYAEGSPFCLQYCPYDAERMKEQQPCERFEWGIDGKVYKITKAKDGKEICQQVCDDAISREDAYEIAMMPDTPFGKHKGTLIRELPSVTQKPIECDDAISRKSIKQKLQEHHDFFVNAYGGFSNLSQNDKSRVDEITNCIAMVVNEPSVTPQQKIGHADQWQELKETIIELRDNDGTGTQQEICKFLANYMDVLEKQMQEPQESEMDCRDCKEYKDCPCGKDGHESGTSQGYSIGECKNFDPQESEDKE